MVVADMPRFGSDHPASAPKEIDKTVTAAVGSSRSFGKNHATAAGNPHSNRSAGDVGAVDCADRGLSRGCPCGFRSALYGLDLFGDDGVGGCVAAGFGAGAARRQMLRVLWCRLGRCRGDRSAAGGIHYPAIGNTSSSPGWKPRSSCRPFVPAPMRRRAPPRPFPDSANLRLIGAAAAVPVGAVQ